MPRGILFLHFYLFIGALLPQKENPTCVDNGRIFVYNMARLFLRSYALLEGVSEHVGIVAFSFIVLSGNKLYVVGIDNCLLERASEICVDGMHYISVGAVRVLS